MPTVIVNGIEVELEPDERLNGIQVAERAGFEVPHYCWHPGLTVVASCRMCLVETGRKDPETGDISMVPKLVPGCQTPATDGTVFVTDSQKVRDARAMVEEDLLIRHPIDCPICDKGRRVPSARLSLPARPTGTPRRYQAIYESSPADGRHGHLVCGSLRHVYAVCPLYA